MTVLNLIRVPIATDALARWAGERGWVRRRGGVAAFDEGRALHHLLDEVLGPGVLRPFRLLVPPRRTGGNLYAYSVLDARSLRAAARAHALPDHLNVLSPDRLESKPMPDVWRVGQQLGFDLLARPVRRLRRDLDTPSGKTVGVGKEIDAFLLEALRRHPTAPGSMVKENRTREAVYLDWLAERLAPAATLDRPASRLARFRRIRVARGDRGPEGPAATVHGTMTVTDPSAFARLLAHGVGRHRAYGYGMLLLRPPNHPAPER
jgi:CRISPR system Cascade subunit CasE